MRPGLAAVNVVVEPGDYTVELVAYAGNNAEMQTGDSLRVSRTGGLCAPVHSCAQGRSKPPVTTKHLLTLYSYVVDHDTGYAPNPYFDLCTLCRCKFRKFAEGRPNIVELAKEGDWVIGTGGATERSAGRGKLVYAMRVDEKLTRWEYFIDSRFENKKPMSDDKYLQARGDNIEPRNDFEKHGQFALVSRYFYYFGAKAVVTPKRFDVEKKGPGFRNQFAPAHISQFVEWLQEQSKPGKHGEPCCQRLVNNSNRYKRCKSSC